MKSMLAIILIAATLAGDADKFTEVKTPHLNQAFIIHSFPTFRGYDYLGSDASHHYFVEKWDYAIDRRFKVKTAEMVVNKTMPVGNAAVEVFPFQLPAPATEEFGKIGGKTLYKKK